MKKKIIFEQFELINHNSPDDSPEDNPMKLKLKELKAKGGSKNDEMP